MWKSVMVVACLVSTAGVASAQQPQPPPAASAPAAVPDTPVAFSTIFSGLGRDLRRLPSRSNALILGVAGLAAAAVHPQDDVLTRHASGSNPVDEVFDAGEFAGSGYAQFGLAFGTYVAGRVTGRAHLTRVGADLVRGQIVNSALTQGIKFAVQRRRPDGGRYSFPSGHTSAAFATAAVIQRHYGWKAAIPAYGLATYVGTSRLSENKHFASDVVFGAAIGIVSGRAVTVGRGRAQFDLFPIARPGGGGVGFMLVAPEARPAR